MEQRQDQYPEKGKTERDWGPVGGRVGLAPAWVTLWVLQDPALSQVGKRCADRQVSSSVSNCLESILLGLWGNSLRLASS